VKYNCRERMCFNLQWSLSLYNDKFLSPISVIHSRMSRNLREKLRTIHSPRHQRDTILPQSKDLSSETSFRNRHNERLGVSKKSDQSTRIHLSRRRWQCLTRALIKRNKRHLSKRNVKSIANYCSEFMARNCRMFRESSFFPSFSGFHHLVPARSSIQLLWVCPLAHNIINIMLYYLSEIQNDKHSINMVYYLIKSNENLACS